MVNGSVFFIGSIILVVTVQVPRANCLQEQILKYTINTNGLGSYSFEYETSKGTFRREDGGLVSYPEGDSLLVRGEYGYISTDGNLYIVKYVADKNGYQPVNIDSDIRYNDRRII